MMNSPYLFCVHLNLQDIDISFNWILLLEHLELKYVYSINRYEAMWKKHLFQRHANSPVLLPTAAPSQQSLCAIPLKNPARESEFCLWSLSKRLQTDLWKQPSQSLEKPIKDDLLPCRCGLFLVCLHKDFTPDQERAFEALSPSFLPSPSFHASQICLGKLQLDETNLEGTLQLQTDNQTTGPD